MSGSYSFSAGNEAALAEDYERAAGLYDTAIAADDSQANYFAARAANNLKLKKYQAAVSDSDCSLRIDPSSGLTHFRRAQGLFYIDRFQEAKNAFVTAEKLGYGQCQIWIRKCDAELKRLGKQTDTPQQNTFNAFQQPTATQLNSNPINSTGTQAHSNSHSNISSSNNNTKDGKPFSSSTSSLPSSSSSSSSSSGNVPAAASVPLSEKVKDGWFQTKSDITLTLFAKNLRKEDIEVSHTLDAPDQIKAILTLPDSSTYERVFHLFAPIDSFKLDLTAYRLEIILKKKEEKEWVDLERKGAAKFDGVTVRDNVNTNNPIAAYPSSAKKKVDVASVEDLAKKMEEEEKPQGEQALQKLFQSMYKDADEVHYNYNNNNKNNRT